MNQIKMIKRCPACNFTLFEKLEPTTGKISIKCPRCRKIVEINLAFLVRKYPVINARDKENRI